MITKRIRWLMYHNTTNNETLIPQTCYWKNISTAWTMETMLDFLLTGPFLTIVIFAGFCGGLMCCFTFWRSMSRMRIYCYLFALAVWDLFFLVTLFFLYNLRTLIDIEITYFGKNVAAVPFLYYVSAVARTGSIWTVLVVALERYMTLCHPFRFEKMNSPFRITVVMISVALFAFAYGSCRYFEVTIKNCYETTTRQPVSYITSSSLRSNNYYWFFYRVIGGSLFNSLLPFLLLLLLTLRISYKLKISGQAFSLRAPTRTSTAYKCRRHDTRIEKRVNDPTIHWMHVAMISKFLLCHTFPTILDIWELVHPSVANELAWKKTWQFMWHTSILLVALNSSCNYFIYYLTSARFRKDSRLVQFCCCKITARRSKHPV